MASKTVTAHLAAGRSTLNSLHRTLSGINVSLRILLHLLGIEPQRLRRTLTDLPKYVTDARSYVAQTSSRDPFPIRTRNLFPVLGESGDQAGSIDGHYFYQDLWAARKIFARSPAEHFDIGSRIDGFVAHVLTFMTVTVIDVRPLRAPVDGLRLIEGDATYLPMIPDGSLVSVSSLHALEHFGLGRYGDPVDPRAPEKAMVTLRRVLAPGGRLYLSVPIGQQRLMFNAHRIFSPDTIIEALSPLPLISFAAVDDEGQFHPEADPEDYRQTNYSCGLFEFGKE
jgi:hypothetical protein